VIAVLASSVISFNGLHYWHDARFLYLVCNFSMHDILAGVFNPHQVGYPIDESSTAGFHYTKILHLSLLKTLFHWIHPSEGGLSIAVVASMVLVGFAAVNAYRVLLAVLKDNRQAVLGLLCFLLAPVTPYLAGKLLSEVTALPFVTICSWMMINASEHSERRRNGAVVACSGFLLLTSLARLDMVMSLVSCLAGLFLTAETHKRRSELFLFSLKVFAIWVTTYVLIAVMLGFSLANLSAYFLAFVDAGGKSSAMSALGVITFGGAVYLLAILSVAQKNERKVWFLMLWFAFAILPHAMITHKYMIEPRYLASALVPLSGLGGVGLATLLKAFNAWKLRYVMAAGVLLLTISLNAIVVRLMPYELDRRALIATVDRILELDPAASLLIPWTYSDFHFLRVMRPQAHIFNVNTPTREDGTSLLDSTWRVRLKRFYGERYLSTREELEKVLSVRPAYYLSWGKYPPLQNAKVIADWLRLRGIVSLLDGIPMMDHSAQSWIWFSQQYHLEPKGEVGQYRYYAINSAN
jgi:hypothetical protein